MALIRQFHTLSRWLDHACAAVCALCVAVMVMLTGAQIVCRLWFTALSWSEELTRYLLVWSTFLGASCVYRRAGHINVTVIQSLFPKLGRQTLQTLCHVLCGIFFTLAVLYGIDYMGMQSRQLSAALRIPMSWVYLAIPVGCGLMLIHVLDHLLGLLPAGRNVEGAR